MNDTWPPSSSPAPPRSRRPRRSATDRKVAGVAGGLGRAFGIDPVLFRVAFVVLTIFGGFGGLLYVLGWLLLADERDDVSAAESLLGRGRSSVPPVLAVGLAVVAAISLFSMFSWGLPFWPLVIIGTVALVVMKKRAGGGCARGRQQGPHWQSRADWRAQHWADRADRWAEQASQWGDQAERWVADRGWAGPGRRQSPFDRPAFWDQAPPSPGSRVDGPPPADTSGVRMTKDAPSPTPAAPTTPPTDPGFDAPRTPPAWDPLGVAPFAWDLPEPGPATPSAPVATRGSGVINRVTLGLTLLAGGLATVGIFAGWWSLTWAAVAAIALSVVGLGLLVSALRGRGYGLVGPGIFLCLVTLALTTTGIRGTDGFGSTTWHPTTVAQVQPEYAVNGGQGVLDLSGLVVPAGTAVPLTVDVRAGHAEVILPKDTAADVTCSANAGQIDCLGQQAEGLRVSRFVQQPGSSDHGTVELTVSVGAGFGEVRNG